MVMKPGKLSPPPGQNARISKSLRAPITTTRLITSPNVELTRSWWGKERLPIPCLGCWCRR